MLAKSGRGGQVVVPRGGAPGGRVQLLVDAIIKLGYVPIQSRNSSATEKILAVRLIRERKAGSLSSEQEAALGNLAQGAAQHLVDTIVELGYLPTQSKNSTVLEQQLAVRLISACNACSLSSEQEAALGNLAQGAAQQLVDTIIQVGYLPTQSKNSTVEEKQLAVRLIKACNSGYLSSEQEGALGNLAQDQAEATAGSGVQ